MSNKETHRQADMKQKAGGEGLHGPGGYMSAYLSQSVYFIGQYKEMNQVKMKLQQFLDLR
jgi:hypothetical protein